MTNDDHTGTDVPAREEGTHSLSAARSATLIGTPPPRPASRVKPVVLMGLLSVVAVVAAIDLGIKARTPWQLAERGVRVHVLPQSTTFDE
ncbi:MAG: hypothetical protein ACFNXV_02475, partial [Pauljensenia sp.]